MNLQFIKLTSEDNGEIIISLSNQVLHLFFKMKYFTVLILFAAINLAKAQRIGATNRGPSVVESIRLIGRMAPVIETKSHISSGPQKPEQVFSGPANFNNIIALPNRATIMFGLTAGENYKYLQTIGYDHFFTKKWQNENLVDSKFDFIGEQTDTSFHYALFNRFIPKNKLKLIQTDVHSGNQKTVSCSLPMGIKMFNYRVVQNNCFLACKYKERPLVILFHLADSSFKVLPNLVNRKANFLSLYADNESFTVLLKAQKNGDLIIKKYDLEGNQLNTFEIPNENRRFNEAKTLSIGNDLVVVGTYTTGLSYKVKGFYTALLNDNFSEKNINYHEFSTLLGYQNQKNEMPPYAIVHNLKQANNDVMCVFDFFDASIQNSEYTGMIRYAKSLVCRIDSVGQIVWKTELPLEGIQKFLYSAKRSQTSSKFDVLESNVKPAMQFLLNKNRLIAACQIGNTVTTSLLDTQNGLVTAKAIYEHGNEEFITDFLPWYDDVFLIWGKNKSNPFLMTNHYMRKMKIVEEKVEN